MDRAWYSMIHHDTATILIHFVGNSTSGIPFYRVPYGFDMVRSDMSRPHKNEMRWADQTKPSEKKTSWKHDLENPWRSFMILQCFCSSMYDPVQSFYKMVGPCWPWSNKKPPLASAAACCAPAPSSESPGAGRASSCSASWSRAPKDRNTGWERYHRNPKEGGSTW